MKTPDQEVEEAQRKHPRVAKELRENKTLIKSFDEAMTEATLLFAKKAQKAKMSVGLVVATISGLGNKLVCKTLVSTLEDIDDEEEVSDLREGYLESMSRSFDITIALAREHKKEGTGPYAEDAEDE